MAKRFKCRICRVISTTFQSCRSKDPSILPAEDPVPVPSLSTLEPNHHHRSSYNHHVPSAPDLPPSKQISGDHLTGTHPQDFKWKEEEKWHVVATIYEQPGPRRKIYTSSEEDRHTQPPMPPPPPPSAAEKKKRRGKKKKKNLPTRFRMSTSSADSGWFSSEGGGGGGTGTGDDEETETLISSLSFSPDSNSPELNPHSQLQPIRESSQNLPAQRIRNKRRVSKRTKHGGVLRHPPPTEVENPARLSMFKKLIPCTVDGKVKESFAIVKRSEDPYEDFKNSMMDMILEKQMFDSKDLEQLLQCFLSLNSKHYHGIIVEAFTEIWETIFSINSAGAKHSGDQYHRRRRGVSKIASF